jgi:CTP-dependent riboflavin kinase
MRPKIIGVIFSDLGRASSFMALDWVRQALQQSLGFVPYPATLNLRPKEPDDLQIWEAVRKQSRRLRLAPEAGGFCNAQLFPIEIHGPLNARVRKVKGAVLLPEIREYPKDKIEVVAPVRLKDEFGVQDGDQVTLEFLS